MRKVDLTKTVMRRVVTFERRRTLLMLARIFLVFLSLFGFGAILLYIVARQIFETKTYELLSLFAEDKEIIAEFWKDTALTIWEEIPKEAIALIIITLVALVLSFLFARKRIGILRKRILGIEKFLKKTKI